MKIQSYILAVLMISLLTLTGCSRKQKFESNNFDKLIEFSKSPCFGHCSVYNLKLYRNQQAILEGKEYIDHKGIYLSKIDAASWAKITKLLNQINWENYKSEYIVAIADLPFTEIQYFGKDGVMERRVKSNATLPNKLDDLQKAIQELVKSQKWTQLQRQTDVQAENYVKNQLIVDIDDKQLSMDNLLKKYIAVELKQLEKISQYMNLYLFEFNLDKIGAYEMLASIRQTPGIRTAEFNKKITIRKD